MGTRAGYLSDENMKMMCASHRPVPLGRIDLLPMTPMNSSGINSGKLKDPRILSRPATAINMLNSTMRLTGRDMTTDYIDGFKTNFQNKMSFNNQILPPTTQPMYTFPTQQNLANLIYMQVAQNLGVGTSIASALSSEPSSLTSAFPDSTNSYEPSEMSMDNPPPSEVSTTESQARDSDEFVEPSEDEEEDERQIRLELTRRGRLGAEVGSEEFEELRTRPVPTNVAAPQPYVPTAIQQLEATMQNQQEPQAPMENVQLNQPKPAKPSRITQVFERFTRTPARVAPKY